MTKQKKRRGPYRCAKCRDYGHRANVCPKKHKMQTILDSLPGDIAMKSLIPDFFQIIAVVEGSTGEALVGAIKGNEHLAEQGITHNNSMINAWSELAMRAAKIPHEVIDRARTARQALLKAEADYADACAPIREVLGHKAPDPTWRHPLKLKEKV